MYTQKNERNKLKKKKERPLFRLSTRASHANTTILLYEFAKKNLTNIDIPSNSNIPSLRFSMNNFFRFSINIKQSEMQNRNLIQTFYKTLLSVLKSFICDRLNSSGHGPSSRIPSQIKHFIEHVVKEHWKNRKCKNIHLNPQQFQTLDPRKALKK